MDKFKELWLKYKQFILFCCVGVSNTVVALIVNWLLLKLCGALHFAPVLFGINIVLVCSSFIGDIAGAVNSYILNSKFVFDSRNKNTGPKFVAAFIIYMVLSAVLVLIVNKAFSIPDTYCKLIVTPVMLVENFLLNKFWVFKKDSSN